jgi:hypothetical protein
VQVTEEPKEMKPFHQWTRDIAKSIKKGNTRSEPFCGEEVTTWNGQYIKSYLDTLDPDLLEFNAIGDGSYPPAFETWEYPCRSCGESTPINCEPHEFDPEYNYCGKNQHCIP